MSTKRQYATGARASSARSAKKARASRSRSVHQPFVFISTGCPCGIGPEVSMRAAAGERRRPCILVGDERALLKAAELCKISPKRLQRLETLGDFEMATVRPRSRSPSRPIYYVSTPTELGEADLRPGHPSRQSGRAQLEAIEAAYELTRRYEGSVLVTGPVSKAAITRSGISRARRFTGHTEWLRDLDGAKNSIMCFVAPQLITSLVTTHMALRSVSQALSAEAVARASVWLARLCLVIKNDKPKIAVCSLNPHAGEGGMFGDEEAFAIVPGIRRARQSLRNKATIEGPVGAETAFRKAYQGQFDGVLAMYHDQATIPMKLVAFGTAVNVTLGLSIVRTSVDHGTGYDIAWQGRADPRGMIHAVDLAVKLATCRL